jgi:hypothetical protein
VAEPASAFLETLIHRSGPYVMAELEDDDADREVYLVDDL